MLAMKLAPNFEAIRGEIRFRESMAKHTSWRVGGPADYWFAPKDKTDLTEFLVALPEDVPLIWTGLGSNLLVRDGGIRGAVICTHQGLSSIETKQTGEVHASAGTACAKVARTSARAGLSGAEFMAGIPGTVGGALAMNAGAYGSESWDIVKSVEVLGRDGYLEIRTRSEFEAGYRSVSLGENEWFTGAVFELSPSDPVIVTETIRTVLNDRSQSQPVGNASAGSVFRNPADDHAARLIESAGLKGRRVGGAVVSSKHANFIINDQGASASDIEQLILLVQSEVLEKFRIELKPEVKIEGVA
jgi:UDP-N-acetylmuramate dehydrogenase